MEFEHYLKVLAKHWRVIAITTVVGAVLGATIALLSDRAPTASSDPQFQAYVDIAALSETGVADFQQAIKESSSYRITTTLEILNPTPGERGSDYRDLLTSDQVTNTVAGELDLPAEDVAAAISTAPVTNEYVITFSVLAESRQVARDLATQIITATRRAIQTTTAGPSSDRLLVSATSPNPDIVTNAAYTLSRVPTYVALATSPAVIERTARALGAEAGDLAASVSVRAESGTAILDVRVRPEAAGQSPEATLAELTDQLESAIRSIESTPVAFRSLGPGPQASAPIVQRVSVESAAPSIVLNAPRDQAARASAQVLGVLSGSDATVIAADLETTIEELRQAPAITETPSNVDIQVAPAPELAEGEPAPAVPRAQTIRVTATADTADLASTTLEESLAELTDGARYVILEAPTPIAGEAVVEPASGGSRLPVNLVLGLLLGAAAGIGYVLWSNARSGVISTPREFEQVVGVSPIGIIAKATDENASETGGVGFRALRTAVLFGLQAPATIAVVAPTDESSAHQVAKGLAAALEASGRQVTVIDATTTTIDPRTLTEPAAQIDHTIVICPPATQDTSAAEIAAQCASTLLVVRVNETSHADVDISARILLQTSTDIGGVVVTEVPEGDLTKWASLIPTSPEPAAPGR